MPLGHAKPTIARRNVVRSEGIRPVSGLRSVSTAPSRPGGSVALWQRLLHHRCGGSVGFAPNFPIIPFGHLMRI